MVSPSDSTPPYPKEKWVSIPMSPDKVGLHLWCSHLRSSYCLTVSARYVFAVKLR